MSLATNGILFLDELGEFSVAALEALRQPLEEGVIRVSRAGGTVTFPAAFLLVAAMNPCPCGEGVYEGACRCTSAARARYRRRISAPLWTVSTWSCRSAVRTPMRFSREHRERHPLQLPSAWSPPVPGPTAC